MTETRWWRYLQGLMDGQTQQEAADRAGISKSNFTRWKQGARADPDFVVKIARSYGANVLKALLEAEFITEKEAGLRTVQLGGPGLQQATNEQILNEIMRRSDPEARALFTAAGDPDTVDLADDTNAEVYHLPGRTSEEELQAVHDALTPYEHRLVDAGKAPDLLTLTDLETWRAVREDAIPERAVADRSPRQGRGYPDDYEP